MTDEIGDWDFQKKNLDYCRDDVNVLRLSWLALWKAMYEITGGLHIGIENCTKASFTNLAWRTTISPNKIGLIPKTNYVKNHTQSKIGLESVKYQDLFYYAGELEYYGKGNGERRVKVGNEMM